ncbi:MAG: hypothetical protein ISS66_03595 [Desulfobacteraceae bacterium]|nr:hypothetical protein [Desulfobacteraceae bacterium]
MNSKMRIGIVIIFTLVIFQLGIITSHSQGNKFIIKLKSGVEITTRNILIEEGVVYYIFSSYGEKKVGIAQSAIAKILERKRSGAVRTINIPLKSKRYSKGKLAKQKGITKSLNKRSDQPLNP